MTAFQTGHALVFSTLNIEQPSILPAAQPRGSSSRRSCRQSDECAGAAPRTGRAGGAHRGFPRSWADDVPVLLILVVTARAGRTTPADHSAVGWRKGSRLGSVSRSAGQQSSRHPRRRLNRRYFRPPASEGLRGGEVRGGEGEFNFVFLTHRGARSNGGRALRTVERSTAKQSNTSLRIGGTMLKIFRNLEPGTHPELEISGFLRSR